MIDKWMKLQWIHIIFMMGLKIFEDVDSLPLYDHTFLSHLSRLVNQIWYSLSRLHQPSLVVNHFNWTRTSQLFPHHFVACLKLAAIFSVSQKSKQQQQQTDKLTCLRTYSNLKSVKRSVENSITLFSEINGFERT